VASQGVRLVPSQWCQVETGFSVRDPAHEQRRLDGGTGGTKDKRAARDIGQHSTDSHEVGESHSFSATQVDCRSGIGAADIARAQRQNISDTASRDKAAFDRSQSLEDTPRRVDR
jgi:hypothetical protein